MIGEFATWQWAAMLVIGLASGLIHGFVGIGFPLVATPLFALLFGLQVAVPMLVPPTLVLVVCTFIAYGHAADPRQALRRYWPLLLTAPVGVVLGTGALFVLDARLLMLMLAGVMGAFLVADHGRRARIPILARHPTAFAFPVGLLAGFCEGTVNVAGPMLLIYFLLLDLEATVIVALMNYLFLLGKSVQAAALVSHGAFDVAVWQAAVPLAICGAAMFFLGVRLRSRANPARYRGWLKATLAVMVLTLLLRVATS